jgi:hypothetical protein
MTMSSLITTTNVVTMTSREIAEITGKRHDNVLRDIDNLLKTLPSDLRTGFSMTYDGDPVHGFRVFVLDHDAALCLVSGYDAVLRMKVIKRWRELELGQATPVVPPAASQYPAVKEAFECFLSIANHCKLEGNAALLSANQATLAATGINPLRLMGHSALVAEVQEQTMSPTQLGRALGDLSPQVTNKLLIAHGLQVVDKDSQGKRIYVLTEKGLQYGRYDRSMVRMVRWYGRALDVLRSDEVT